MIDYLLSPLARNLIVANQIFAQAFVHENNFLGRFRSWALTHNLLRRGPGEDDIGGVFGDHVDGANDEHPWYSRERGAGSRRQVGERRVPCLRPCVARWATRLLTSTFTLPKMSPTSIAAPPVPAAPSRLAKANPT